VVAAVAVAGAGRGGPRLATAGVARTRWGAVPPARDRQVTTIRPQFYDKATKNHEFVKDFLIHFVPNMVTNNEYGTFCCEPEISLPEWEGCDKQQLVAKALCCEINNFINNTTGGTLKAEELVRYGTYVYKALDI
jgi:hypothetical protein